MTGQTNQVGLEPARMVIQLLYRYQIRSTTASTRLKQLTLSQMEMLLVSDKGTTI